MSLLVTQDEISIRSNLEQNKQTPGLKGKQLLESENVAETRALIGVGRKNLLVNSNFDIWQRGTSFIHGASDNKYGSDRWKGFTNVDGVFSKDPEGLLLTKTTGAGIWAFIAQILESDNTTHLNGKTITLSAKVKAVSGTDKCQLSIGGTNGKDNVSVSSSPIFARHNIMNISETEFTTISLTTKVPTFASDFTLAVFVQLRDTSTIIDNASILIKEVQLEEGENVTNFEHQHMADEIQLCQRYYQKSYEIDTDPGTNNTSIGSIREGTTRNTANTTIGTRFNTRMRRVPTTQVFSTVTGVAGVAENSGDKAASPIGLGETGFAYVTIASGTTASSANYHYTANAEI